ncbi:MAG: UDP-N-acetylmuramoyl-tripeptide--D-alanyl-D-alanine ligase [Lachnospiraceae bacterium]|nr:UDP-N-acetylmuramoyl-tripeptide--D-alanyl-D-alanine ligase [Candidatus Equihabitans merdae]
MKSLTPARMAQICHGTLSCPEEIMENEITAVVTDSRRVEEGCLFVPIKGAKVDAHDFIPQVMENGAMLTLTERGDTVGEYPCILVRSTVEAFQALAKAYIEELNTPVISITGSVGKTSTKETVAAVLNQKYNTLKTLGNFNNDLGLPMTIFRLDQSHERAVLEMGISHFGDMTVLANIANPDISVITNIGSCHLEHLGDLDGVLKAKTEVFDFLKDGACVVLNGDDAKLSTVKEVKGKKPYFFGLNPENDFWADEICPAGIKGIACHIHTPEGDFKVVVPQPGQHMVYNALAATAVGQLSGLSLDEIKQGIEKVESISGRFHIVEKEGLTIINDCYNANPMSMKASLGILRYAAPRRVAILGDMGELGKDEAALHASVGEFMTEQPPELLITCGELTQYMVSALTEKCPEADVVSFDELSELIASLQDLIQKGDTILVKASHFMQFDKVTEALENLDI